MTDEIRPPPAIGTLHRRVVGKRDRRRQTRNAVVVIEWNGVFGDFQLTTCHGNDWVIDG